MVCAARLSIVLKWNLRLDTAAELRPRKQ